MTEEESRTKITIPTQFAPADRSPEDELRRQVQFFSDNPARTAILDAVPDIVVILNPNRQIVFANKAMVDFAKVQERADLYGLRPGEALGCLHANETEGGCGTTEFCSTCGAVKAILFSQKGKVDVEECCIMQAGSNNALDLRVWGTPFIFFGEEFSIFTAKDISDEKRKDALERIFFHDVLNTAGGLQGFADLLKEATPEEIEDYRIKEVVPRLANRLVEEIDSHRMLIKAENDSLSVLPGRVDPKGLLEDVIESFQAHDVAKDRILLLEVNEMPKEFISDGTLLSRVIGNMTKNALEASSPGETVTLSCVRKGEQVEFRVHNPAFMPREVQLQIFQRTFSTKGQGRGLGTYSMKLISERFLKGSVTFATSPDTGTTFIARYPSSLE